MRPILRGEEEEYFQGRFACEQNGGSHVGTPNYSGTGSRALWHLGVIYNLQHSYPEHRSEIFHHCTLATCDDLQSHSTNLECLGKVLYHS